MKRSQAVEGLQNQTGKLGFDQISNGSLSLNSQKRKRHEDSGVLSFKIKLEVIYKMV